MLVFNCTKDAADLFTATRKGKKISPISPMPKLTLTEEPILHDHQCWHWMIHVTKFGHKTVLLAMDTDSRFCMVFWGLRKGNTQNFLKQFHDRLSIHIVAMITMSRRDEILLKSSMESFLENHHTYAFVQRGDRSVQAHINDALKSFQYEQYYWEDVVPTEEELFTSDLKNNDTPRKRKQDKDYIFPTEILLGVWLSRYANFDEETTKHTISQYRQTNNQLRRSQFEIDIDDLDINEIEAIIAASLSDDIFSLEN